MRSRERRRLAEVPADAQVGPGAGGDPDVSPGAGAARHHWDSGWRCEVGCSVTLETPVRHRLCTQFWLSLQQSGRQESVGKWASSWSPRDYGSASGDGPRAGPGRASIGGRSQGRAGPGVGVARAGARPSVLRFRRRSAPPPRRCPPVLGFRQGSWICGFLVFIRVEVWPLPVPSPHRVGAACFVESSPGSRLCSARESGSDGSVFRTAPALRVRSAADPPACRVQASEQPADVLVLPAASVRGF